VANEAAAVALREIRHEAAMARVEAVVLDAASITMRGRRCTAAACREATEAVAIDITSNAIRDAMATCMEAVEQKAHEKANFAIDDAEEEDHLAEADVAMAWVLLGKKEEEEEALWQVQRAHSRPAARDHSRGECNAEATTMVEAAAQAAAEAERVAEEERTTHREVELDAALVHREEERRLADCRAECRRSVATRRCPERHLGCTGGHRRGRTRRR
jgi:hypothetical protein